MSRVMMERETEMERANTTKKRIAKEESQMSAALCFACKMAYTSGMIYGTDRKKQIRDLQS